MKLCAISFKESWQGEDGKWYSYGGFPMQMTYIGGIFDEMTLVITDAEPREGGILLPEFANIVALKKPKGADGSRKLYMLKQLPYYLKSLNKEINKADIIHIPLPGDIPLLALMLTLLKGKKLIARYGGSWENNAQTTAFSKFTKWLMKRFAGGKRVMLATGVGETPPAPNMHWIFSTVLTQADIDKIKPNLNRSLSETVNLVYIGRLSSEKGVHILLKAITLLTKEQPDIKLHLNIIGGGPQENELKNIVKDNSIEHLVTFKGQLSKEVLIEEVKKADICIQPSLTEGFSKAWLDAFSCGLPIIASKVGAASSVIKDNRGWLVPPGDEIKLKETMLNVITDNNINWPETRENCAKFVTQLTIENWQKQIKTIATSQWEGIK